MKLAAHTPPLLRSRRQFLSDALVGAGVLAMSGCVRTAKVSKLRNVISGPVLVPGDTGYERYRPLFNRRYDGVYPAVLILPRKVDDIRFALDWANQHGISLCPRGGGHSYLGNSICSGMVIDLRYFSKVRSLSTREPIVEIGGGARLIDVSAEVGARNWSLPLGSCPTVGIGGFTLGGGIGLSSRLLGLACDRLLGVEFVAADGRVVQANQNTHSDLFWACRGGGGGQLGIVTRMRMRAHPAPRVSWFTMKIPWQRAPDVLRYWQAWAPSTPHAFTSIFQLTSGPSARCKGQFYGSKAQLARLLAKLAKQAKATPTLGEGTTTDANMVWANCRGRTLAQCSLPADNASGTLRRGHYDARGLLFSYNLPDEAIEHIFHYLLELRREPRRGSILLDAWGGAIAEVAPGATAFPHRNIRFSAQIIQATQYPTPFSNWSSRFWSSLRPFANDGMYSNYSFVGLDGWQQAIWGDNLQRMWSEKCKWDPQDVFHGRQVLRANAFPYTPLSPNAPS